VISQHLIAVTLVTLLFGAPSARAAESPQIPITPGLKLVLAVSGAESAPGSGILQGDYEMVVAFKAVTEDKIVHSVAFDGEDESKAQRQFTVTRSLTDKDLLTARVQILGFHTRDPGSNPGTSSLGPSRGITQALVTQGKAAYRFKLFSWMDDITGTLTRTSDSAVKFPVLLNGKRVELDAIRVIGPMTLGAKTKDLEMVILDHPRYPLSLRVAHGTAVGERIPKPDFIREIVRIDLPEPALAKELAKECRAELRGLYFDFNQATLRPESQPALEEIAAALKAQSGRSFRVEGHTDNVGSDSFNADLSSRRAAAVKAALVSQFAVDAARLATQGYGEKRPVESNDTLAGRARNRRVELVCTQ